MDGFNLYHPLDELNKPHLKWLNHWRLAELVADQGDDLVKVTFCTAYHPDFKKRVRHERYILALENVGVTVLRGHYIHEPMSCNGCGRQWQKPTEKQGDLNVALSLFDDAYRDTFDHAYLISADSDQAATARMMRDRFPDKRLYSVTPPGRPHSHNILSHTPHHKTLTEAVLDLAVLPRVVIGTDGRKTAIRPFEYDPPAGWVHPNDRPT